MQNPPPKEVGLRIRAILRECQMSIERASQVLEIPRQNLSNPINGYQLPSHGLARKLIRLLPGLTLEWLYWGDARLVPSQLNHQLCGHLAAIRKELNLPPCNWEPTDIAAG